MTDATPAKRILVVSDSSGSAIAQHLRQALDELAIKDYVVVEVAPDDDAELWTRSTTPASLLSRLAADVSVRGLVINVPLGAPLQAVLPFLRHERKDLFVVCFNETSGEAVDSMYACGLGLLKLNSLNLVVAVDTLNSRSFIVAPEETRYCPTEDRGELLAFLAQMTVSRMQNRFTRSTVIPGDSVPWHSNAVPANLRAVVDHCIAEGAYKPVLGKTAGHFAVKAGRGDILTSIRKSDFNDLERVGLVRVTSTGPDRVIAHGHRPSVGGQSQRIIFNDHPELDCIVHFHCPVKADAPLKALIPVRPQWPNECGSHECGRNTSQGLRQVDLGEGHSLSVVYLDSHGPNIVFDRSTPATKVKAFIDANFDLRAKTGGLAAMGAH